MGEPNYISDELMSKFREKGYIIELNNISDYEKEFEKRKKIEPNVDFWKDKRVLITGISGFVGSHLAEKLIGYGSHVFGIVRRRSVPYFVNINHIKNYLTLYTCDLSSSNQLNVALKDIKPDFIFHLAAESFVPMSFSEPTKVVGSNINGTLNLLEAARHCDVSKIHIAGSSEQYGLVKPEDCPLNELTQFNPKSVYAITKIATEHIANLYYDSYELPTVVTRAFNHTGPRRGLEFVTSSILKQIIYNKQVGNSNISLGNISPYRDFTDVRDIIRGYMLVAEKGKPRNPYVLASGKAISILNLANLAMKISGSNMNIITDVNKFRPAEVPFLLGDYSKIKKDIGWEPTISLTHTLRDMFDYFGNNAYLLN